MSEMTPLNYEELRSLMVAAGLFVLGAIGFLTRRNLILLVLSAELMLHGVSLSLVTFGKIHQNQEGQAFTIFVLTVAACEAGLALSLVLALYRQTHSLDIRLWSELREFDTPVPVMADADGRTTVSAISLRRNPAADSCRPTATGTAQNCEC